MEKQDKAIITVDENGFVIDYIEVGGVDDGVEIDIIDDFDYKHRRAYQLVNGKLEFDENKKVEIDKQIEIGEIRARRENECFQVVNRGGIWYDTLTEQEKSDLMDWYQAWLEAPETLIIPEKPTWLK